MANTSSTSKRRAPEPAERHRWHCRAKISLIAVPRAVRHRGSEPAASVAAPITLRVPFQPEPPDDLLRARAFLT
jgi:hypothetical protein